MAVRDTDKFAVIPLKDSWFDIYVHLEDKCLTVYGKDKNEPGPWATVGDFKNYDELVLIGCALEQSRDDRTFNQILGEAVNDTSEDPRRFLIIDRRETFDSVMNGHRPITEEFLISKGWIKNIHRTREYILSTTTYTSCEFYETWNKDEKGDFIKEFHIYDFTPEDGMMYSGSIPTESQYEVLNQLLKLHA